MRRRELTIFMTLLLLVSVGTCLISDAQQRTNRSRGNTSVPRKIIVNEGITVPFSQFEEWTENDPSKYVGRYVYSPEGGYEWALTVSDGQVDMTYRKIEYKAGRKTSVVVELVKKIRVTANGFEFTLRSGELFKGKFGTVVITAKDNRLNARPMLLSGFIRLSDDKSAPFTFYEFFSDN